MNRTQINYIRECLAIRKKRLMSTYCTDLPVPPEVIAAEQLITEHREERYRRRARIQRSIEDRIRMVEEQLILGDQSSALAAMLADLDGWRPEE